jgi:hypothetical protein
VTSNVFEDSTALAIFPRRQVLDDARPLIMGASERRIDVRHAYLDQVCDAAAVRRDTIHADIRDDDGAVNADAQLGAMSDATRAAADSIPNVARGLTVQRCVAAASETVERDLIGAWLSPRLRSVRSPVAANG